MTQVFLVLNTDDLLTEGLLLSHTEDLAARPHAIAIITISYERLTNSPIGLMPSGLFYQHGLTLIPAWISNYTPGTV